MRYQQAVRLRGESLYILVHQAGLAYTTIAENDDLRIVSVRT